MIINYFVEKQVLVLTRISGQAVDAVKTYKYFGTVADNKLNGKENQVIFPSERHISLCA